MTAPVSLTYVGVQLMAGVAMLLVNDSSGSTKVHVFYDDEKPVTITEVGECQ